MALTRAIGVRNAATTPLDARLVAMATLQDNSDGTPRTGVITGSDGLVTALATMNVAIAAAYFAASKSKADGVTVFTNDGTVNVPITAAPASNSRIDVIWVRHQDSTTGDAASTPIFGVTAGTAAASPTMPAIPTGALELATLRVYAGTTAANGGSNVLTNTYQMTGPRGSTITTRSIAERDAWSAPNGAQCYVIATDRFYVRRASGWRLIEDDVVNAWTTLTAATGWTANSGVNAPQVSRRAGTVFYHGGFYGGAANSTATTVPAWAVPAREYRIPVVLANNVTVGTLRVYASGIVQPSGDFGASTIASWPIP